MIKNFQKQSCDEILIKHYYALKIKLGAHFKILVMKKLSFVLFLQDKKITRYVAHPYYNPKFENKLFFLTIFQRRGKIICLRSFNFNTKYINIY